MAEPILGTRKAAPAPVLPSAELSLACSPAGKLSNALFPVRILILRIDIENTAARRPKISRPIQKTALRSHAPGKAADTAQN